MREAVNRLLPFLALMCLSLLACKDVQTRELVGTWSITGQSRHLFLSTEQQKAEGTVILGADGSFVATAVPDDLLFGPPQAQQVVVTGSGVWKLLVRDGQQKVQLTFEKFTGGVNGPLPYGTQLSISRGWSSLTLFYFRGDPDQAYKIEFEKR